MENSKMKKIGKYTICILAYLMQTFIFLSYSVRQAKRELFFRNADSDT